MCGGGGRGKRGGGVCDLSWYERGEREGVSGKLNASMVVRTESYFDGFYGWAEVDKAKGEKQIVREVLWR